MAKKKKAKLKQPWETRSFITMQEILHGSGTGVHQSKKKRKMRNNKTHRWMEDCRDKDSPLFLVA